jgi:hypothetical protein
VGFTDLKLLLKAIISDSTLPKMVLQFLQNEFELSFRNFGLTLVTFGFIKSLVDLICHQL